MFGVVLDTNVLIKGFLSHKNPCRQILNQALSGDITIYGNDLTYKEFCEVLDYEGIARITEEQLFTKNKLKDDYEALVVNIPTNPIYSNLKICKDPDDDEFFKVALSSKVKLLISTDKHHVLSINKYKDVYAISPEKYLELFNENK